MSGLLGQLLSLDDSHNKRSRKETARAPFGYPGSKERSLKQLMLLVPYRDRYIEHCGGSGAMLLARNESPLEVFNDRHSGITAFYKCIADRAKCKELADRISMSVHSREMFEWAKETWETMADDIDRAHRWYYSLATSFNQKGWQWGRSTKPPGFLGGKIRNAIQHFDPLHYRLRNVQIENLDWRVCLDDYDADDAVHYFDPPYWGVQRTYDHHWEESDHVEMCERIMRGKGFFAVSGYDLPEHPYNNFKWDEKHSWEVAVSATALAFTESNNMAHMEGLIKRGKATETLWIKRTS